MTTFYQSEGNLVSKKHLGYYWILIHILYENTVVGVSKFPKIEHP